MSTVYSQASIIVPQSAGYQADILHAWNPQTSSLVDFDVVRNTTATRVNESGLIESVAANVPRIDWPIGGGCPSLLVEPQRTNLFTYSEEFDDADWSKTQANVTANTDIAPDGETTADTITAQAAQNFPRVAQTLSLTNNTNYVLSVFVKKIDAPIIRLRVDTSEDIIQSSYNIDTLAIVNIDGAGGSIEQYPNGWVRASLLFNSGSDASSVEIRPIAGNVSDGSDGFFDGKSVIAWGAQLEEGETATSYIPTTSATVTRNADVISKTGISSLIGQSEGTLYAEVDLSNLESKNRIIAIGDGTTSNRIVLLFNTSNRIRGLISSSFAIQADISTSTLSSGTYKIAFAYGLNNIALFVNGVLIGTDTSATIPACSNVYLGVSEFDNLSQLNDGIRAAAILPARLTNAELEALTTL